MSLAAQATESDMTHTAWLQLLIVVLLGTIAQIALKHALDKHAARQGDSYSLARSPWTWTWLVCYGVSTILWLITLRTVPLSQAFPILGLQFALVPIASAVLLKETVVWEQWLGVVIIVLGVMLLGRG